MKIPLQINGLLRIIVVLGISIGVLISGTAFADQKSERKSPRIPLVNPEDIPSNPGNAATKLTVYRLLEQAPTLHPNFSKLGHSILTDTKIPPLEREFMILLVSNLEQGKYMWLQHAQVARDIGMPQEKIDAIAASQFDSSIFSAREKALINFTHKVVKDVRVDDQTFDAVAAFYSPRELVESIFVIGVYMMVARLTEVAELDTGPILGAKVVREKVEAYESKPKNETESPKH